jgi:hypothetical protein
MGFQRVPVSFRIAQDFVRQHHRHHDAPWGWKFGVGASQEDRLVGVAVVARPVNRHMDDGKTLEVTRLCTDGTKNASSYLLGKAARETYARGYTSLITYTLPEEGGSSLRAAGWDVLHLSRGGSWNVPSRPRTATAPTGPKVCWYHTLGPKGYEPALRSLGRMAPMDEEEVWKWFSCGNSCPLHWSSWRYLDEGQGSYAIGNFDDHCVLPLVGLLRELPKHTDPNHLDLFGEALDYLRDLVASSLEDSDHEWPEGHLERFLERIDVGEAGIAQAEALGTLKAFRLPRGQQTLPW